MQFRFESEYADMDSDKLQEEILNELRKEKWILSKDDKEALAFLEILQEYGLVEKGETDPVRILMKKMGYTLPTKQPKLMRRTENP